MAKRMKTEEMNRIEILLERFFDGETSHDEEKELYAFFENPHLPERWKPYRSLFVFLGNGLPDASSSLSPADFWQTPPDLLTAGTAGGKEKEKALPFCPPPSTRKSGKSGWAKICRFAAGCAAAILLAVVGFPLLFPASTSSDPYEGSYLIRNGVRIVDSDRIRPELEATLCRVALLEKKMEEKLHQPSLPHVVLQPEMDRSASVYTDLLIRYPEGRLRNEVRKMLGLGERALKDTEKEDKRP